MRHRYELSSRQWARIEPLLPHRTHHGGPGRPWKRHGPLVNGILWVLHSGAPWRDVPERYGPWQTVYDRFNRWRQDGTWAKILTRLLDHLEKHGRLGHRLWCVDASVIRASRAAAGAAQPPEAAPTGTVKGWRWNAARMSAEWRWAPRRMPTAWALGTTAPSR